MEPTLILIHTVIGLLSSAVAVGALWGRMTYGIKSIEHRIEVNQEQVTSQISLISEELKQIDRRVVRLEVAGEFRTACHLLKPGQEK